MFKTLSNTIDLFFFGLYRLVVIPFVIGLLSLLRPFLSGKLRLMIDERRTPQKPALVARPVWIHAASGEIEYAKPVIRALKEKYPQIPVLVTYFSPSAHRLVKSIEGIDAFVPVPWDHRKQVARFLEYANPIAVLFARTDVWPELAFQLKNLKVPTILFSATLAANSSRNRGVSRFLNRFALNTMDEIFCVNAEDEREFRAMGVTTSIEVLGDSRFDQVLFRLHNPKTLKNLKPRSGDIFVAGSTWPQDDKVLFAGLKKFISQGGKVIWAPHEVGDQRLQELEAQFQKQSWKSVRYSSARSWTDEKILLIDQIGILPEIYTWGHLAFVGGSFKDRVHSVMEPLAAGLPVFVGPYHENNREALHFALKSIPHAGGLTVVHSIQNSEDLESKIDTFLNNANFPDFKSFIKREVIAQSGVTRKIVEHLHWN